jgi:hypothetical protein
MAGVSNWVNSKLANRPQDVVVEGEVTTTSGMDFNTVITHMSRVKCFVMHRPGTGSERENQRYEGEVNVTGTLGEALAP